MHELLRISIRTPVQVSVVGEKLICQDVDASQIGMDLDSTGLDVDHAKGRPMRKSVSFTGTFRSGFTMLEIMIVVSIIGLFAVIAIPYLRKTLIRARDTAYINDLRMLVDNVMEQYAISEGTYPEDAPAGVEPTGVSEYMVRHLKWEDPTPIGGLWDWDRAATRAEKLHECYAGLSVIGPSRTSAQMREIDSRIDDGNLRIGSFRSHLSGYIYILEK
ncbi:MAG: prepilin-type N-terminal cleavage/methylation domain-containing protein [Kiritimatiellae bacterium]|nr:prepilin-type N-terminal cleavage/methylation domain-containing protein [Kiritimatiellia bacterium]